MSTGEIAEQGGVHRTSVFYWIKTGKLVPTQVVNGIRLFDSADVEKLLAERAADHPPTETVDEPAQARTA